MLRRRPGEPYWGEDHYLFSARRAASDIDTFGPVEILAGRWRFASPPLLLRQDRRSDFPPVPRMQTRGIRSPTDAQPI